MTEPTAVVEETNTLSSTGKCKCFLKSGPQSIKDKKMVLICYHTLSHNPYEEPSLDRWSSVQGAFVLQCTADT